MLSSLATRRLLGVLAPCHRVAGNPRRLSSGPPPLPTPPQVPSEEQPRPQKEIPRGASPGEAPRAAKDDGSDRRQNFGSHSSKVESEAGKLGEEQARVLRAALPHVVNLGWTESALIAGAKDVGLSPAVVGSIAGKEAALIEFFMDDCLQRVKAESPDELKDLTWSDRKRKRHIKKLVCMRLEMLVPYLSKWPQALSVQAQSENYETTCNQRLKLMLEIWRSAGDSDCDYEFCAKRTVLSYFYINVEEFMISDDPPVFEHTWMLVDRYVTYGFDLLKSIRKAENERKQSGQA